ncbi:bifunctional UDP-sugar hydrolase/5'-nucleotidase [Paenibacillus tarimensis]
MQTQSSVTLSILVTSDIHGYIYPTDYRNTEERNWGLAKIATLIKQQRQRCTDVLLIDNGDVIQGSPLTYHSTKFNSERIHPSIAALNELRYDAAVFGNHEFNYGRQLLDQAVRDSDFPWVSANIVDSDTSAPAFGKPYVIKIIQNEIKVAVLGATTHFIPNWERPEHIEGLHFSDALNTVKQWVELIRREERPDVLIVAYHGGFERDLASGLATEAATGENQGYAMCTTMEGIDVLITGHQHRLIAGELNGVTCVQPGSNGQALGKISVELTKNESGWVIQRKRAELIVPDEHTEADRDLLALINDMERETQDWLDQPLGLTEGDMTIADPFEVRTGDHPFIEFINIVQMKSASVDISCTALLSNESKGFAERITMRDILSNYMYPNTLTVLRLSGRDIKDALEKTADYFKLKADGSLGINPDYIRPKPQHYNYDMWEGIEYRLNISNPAGERVVKLFYKGHAIDLDAQYDVVMNNYRAAGGGDYFMFQGKPVVKEIQIDMVELLANYVLEERVIISTCNHNWSVIY